MQMFRAILTVSFLAVPVALFAQDKPKPTDKPDDQKAKSAKDKVLRVYDGIDDKVKPQETKPAIPVEVELKGALKANGDKPNPQETKPAKPVEVELKATVKSAGEKTRKDEPAKPAKPEEPWKIELKYVPERAKAIELRYDQEKAKPADTKPARPAESKPLDSGANDFELEFRIVPNTPAKAKPDQPKPTEAKPETPQHKKAAQYLLQFLNEEAKQAKAKPAKPEQPQQPGKPIEVQLQYKVERDGDTDQKLQKLEAQLQALLKEIQAMRAGKATWSVKPVEPKPAPEQPKVLMVPSEHRKALVVPAQPGAAPAAKPQQPTPLGVPVAPPAARPQTTPPSEQPYYPPADALQRHTVRGRLVESGSGDVINLTRSTYALPAASAKALDDFLKSQVKAKVLETKVEGDRIIVTTTPEVQRIIAQFIALMQGKTPVTAAPTPATPAVEYRDAAWLRVLGEPVKEGKLWVAPAEPAEEALYFWLEGKPAPKTAPEGNKAPKQ